MNKLLNNIHQAINKFKFRTKMNLLNKNNKFSQNNKSRSKRHTMSNSTMLTNNFCQMKLKRKRINALKY